MATHCNHCEHIFNVNTGFCPACGGTDLSESAANVPVSVAHGGSSPTSLTNSSLTNLKDEIAVIISSHPGNALRWYLIGGAIVLVAVVLGVMVAGRSTATPSSNQPVAATNEQVNKATPSDLGVSVVPGSEKSVAAPPKQTSQDSAPSFDCAKARTLVEQTICGDPELSNLDRRLSEAYLRHRESLNGVEKTVFVNLQRAWLSTYGISCEVISDDSSRKRCILQALSDRIAFLSQE